MTDPRLKRLADVLVNYSVGVKPGDWIWLLGDTAGEPLVNEVYRQVIKAGGNVSLNLSNDVVGQTFFEEANEDQLNWVSPTTKMLYEKVNGLISVSSSTNTRS